MTAALEDAKIVDVNEWKTLNTAASSTKLPAGESPNMQNVWVDEKPGSVITANGYVKVGTTPSGLQPTLIINFFISSTGSQSYVISDNATVWTTTDFQTFTSIITGLSSSFQLRGLVVRDKLWLTNGSDSVRTYDGTTVTVLDSMGGTPLVPKGKFIAYHDERIWLYQVSGKRSQVAFSALTDTSGTAINPDNANAWPTSNTLQISEGDADFGTGMILYRGYLYFFKQYSIWRLVGYDEYTYTRVKTRASSGTRFNESLQILDNLVHFIGIDGIYVFDGEETSRISDIIDASADDSVAFSFNNLAQPSQNTSFFEVQSTADWQAGTVSRNLSINNGLTLIGADDTQTDFQAGTTQTNIETISNPNAIQLQATTSGPTASTDLSLTGSAAAFFESGSGSMTSAAYLNDGSASTQFTINASAFVAIIEIVLTAPQRLRYITLQKCNVSGTAASCKVILDGSTTAPSSISGTGAALSGNGFNLSGGGESDIVIDMGAISTRYTTVAIEIQMSAGSNLFYTYEFVITSGQINTTGQFISQALDLGITPASLGTFNAHDGLGADARNSITYYTQSSADGVTWDAAVAVTNGTAIGSTARRYLRWRADLVSAGATTPVILNVFLPGVVLSAVHDTGGSISSWGPFESTYSAAGQTLNFYYRGATTAAGVLAAAFTQIVPGGTISMATANRYVQFKVEVLSGTDTAQPTITNGIMNWVVGSGTQAQILQNVASFAWRNRYWLSATQGSGTANNIILIRGKKPRGSPWQLKDWNIVSFCRSQDSLYGGSSTDGSIYLLESTHSKNGAAMDSFFDTADFTFGGFYITPKEVLLEVERMGTYNLSFGYSINRGTTWKYVPVDLTLSSFAKSYIKRINIDAVNTDRIRFRVRINGIDQPFQVHSLKFFYSMNAARGSIQ